MAARPLTTIHLETTLAATADRVWSAMRYPGTFLYVARGLLGMPSLQGRCEPFHAGEVGTGWLFLLHVIPLSRHTIEVTAVDPDRRTITTHEHGGLLRVWDHTLHVEPVDDRTCRYADTIEVDAGGLTPLVARIATAIFRYRQRRWHRLVRRHLTDLTG
jgi:hypothetical protein